MAREPHIEEKTEPKLSRTETIEETKGEILARSEGRE